MSFISEFKEFAVKGNVMDMAVGIVIGTAFGQITSSLVNDVIMPPLGALGGAAHFNELTFTLMEATADRQAILINYGLFIQTVVNFLIIALVMFMVIKGVNGLKRKQETAPPEDKPAPTPPPREEVLLEEIRDLLAKK